MPFLFKGFMEPKLNVPQSNSQRADGGRWHLEKGYTLYLATGMKHFLNFSHVNTSLQKTLSAHLSEKQVNYCFLIA